jgi:hypothetical protein
MLSNLVGIPSFASRISGQTLTKEQPGVNVTAQTEEKPQNADPQLGPAAPTPHSSRTTANGEIPKIKRFGQLNGGDRIDHVRLFFLKILFVIFVFH